MKPSETFEPFVNCRPLADGTKRNASKFMPIFIKCEKTLNILEIFGEEGVVE